MNCVRCTSLVVRLPFTTARHLPCLWKLWHRSCRNEWGLPTYQLTQLREWHRILFSIIFFFSWNKTNFLYRIFTFWFLYICLKQYFFFLGGVLGKRCYWEIFYVKESDWIFFFFLYRFSTFLWNEKWKKILPLNRIHVPFVKPSAGRWVSIQIPWQR